MGTCALHEGRFVTAAIPAHTSALKDTHTQAPAARLPADAKPEARRGVSWSQGSKPRVTARTGRKGLGDREGRATVMTRPRGPPGLPLTVPARAALRLWCSPALSPFRMGASLSVLCDREPVVTVPLVESLWGLDRLMQGECLTQCHAPSKPSVPASCFPITSPRDLTPGTGLQVTVGRRTARGAESHCP